MGLVGCADIMSHSQVLGWAMDTDRPQAALDIAILVNGKVVARCRADHERAGLKHDLGDEATGKYEFRHRFDPPLSPFKPWQLDIQVEGYTESVTNHACSLFAPAAAPSPMLPVIITSTGPAGSTALMRELVGRPDIVAADLPPYEIKLCAYYASAYRALTSGADRLNSTNPDMMFDGPEQYRIGHNPYNIAPFFSAARQPATLARLFQQDIPTQYAELFRNVIVDYYTALKYDGGKLAAALFAEKGDVDDALRLGVRMLFGRVREVVLLRDPRDLLNLARAAWKVPAIEALERLSRTVPRLADIQRTADADTHFLRYEDLLLSPKPSRAALYRFLGLPLLDPAIEGPRLPVPAPDDAISAWRAELSPAEITACEERFADYMALFGYEPLTVRKTPSQLTVFQGASAVERMATLPALAGGKPMREVANLEFTSTGNGLQRMGPGWSIPEREGTWTDGPAGELVIPVPNGGASRLRLSLSPFIRSGLLDHQRLELAIDGVTIGDAVLGNFAVVECALPRHTEEATQPRKVVIRCPDARRPSHLDPTNTDGRLLGFLLHRATLYDEAFDDPADAAGPPAIVAPAPIAAVAAAAGVATALAPASERFIEAAQLRPDKLMGLFESIGENCEFGLVQRRAGIEPLGLLRFTSSPFDKLMAALKARFAGLGKPDRLEVRVSDNGTEYLVNDQAFGFLYHAWVLVGEKPLPEVHAREVKRLPFLVRKLLETLESGDKICVFHGMTPLTDAQATELATTLRGIGPTTLMWVELTDADHPPGSVIRVSEGLLKAHVDRFAPGENAHDFSFESWMQICRQAVAMWERP